MTSTEIRKAFLDFFTSKSHHIVASAPIVVKNDPSLMFINAGMNQFKDIFLGNQPAKFPRVANSQKCLRVSGKHNDLEEVGHDTYHHTFFEMLGNWSFADYFKKEAITWAWEFLTEVMKINPSDLYVTVFGGDAQDGTAKDTEAYDIWKSIIDENRILFGSKKDNFWEMGDSGPCGPCSEIHIDLRSEEEKQKTPGKLLVNADHPLVIEIWNLVFIQYNRTASGQLELLPHKFVDTGMGFERLCMVLQGKQSNYDTDVFQPIIQAIALQARHQYGINEQQDIAMRVIADHLRAVSFAITDGQLPSNTGAGYVIRRILRRAVRYGYTFLDFKQPFLCELLPILVKQMGEQFPEIARQQQLVYTVIKEEEVSFLRTLSYGIQKFEQYTSSHQDNPVINGKFAFELFDTYGFPIDLTQLMAQEKGMTVDMKMFEVCLKEQQERSRTATNIEADDWQIVHPDNTSTVFSGYDTLSVKAHILRYRKMNTKDQTFYQLVLDNTPFYAEGGGQVGDAGILKNTRESIAITNTKKENNLHIHICNRLPEDLTAEFTAEVDVKRRQLTANNHSATHLLHFALRQVLGNHVEQKGSFVNAERLRFDFSHFAKISKEDLRKVENIVNGMIRENIPLTDHREVPIEQAKNMGAMALFGEKYGDKVRVVQFGPSIEFCGGTHTSATGNIGMLHIVSESAIAAGIRRIEAITAETAEKWMHSQQDTLETIQALCNSKGDLTLSVKHYIEENARLKKQVEHYLNEKMLMIKDQLLTQTEHCGDIQIIRYQSGESAETIKNLTLLLKPHFTDSKFAFVGGSVHEGKPSLTLFLSQAMVDMGLNAGNIVRAAAKKIDGGGGGQAYLATAGGKNADGITQAMDEIINAVKQQ
ncbi:MAG: alanine--tRNA ligase [Bacteroidales bacterium]|nr:alanine--tRNA ligase [Bacteroidales bacterium]